MPIIFAPTVPQNPGSLFSSICTCPSDVAVGDAVYFTGPSAVDLADALSVSTAPAIGLVFSKPTTTTCIVMLEGEFTGLSGIVTDATYYLDDTAGDVTTTPPSAPGEVVQPLAVGKNTTTLILTPNRNYVVL